MEEIKYEYKERGIGLADDGDSALRASVDPPTETRLYYALLTEELIELKF